MNMLRHDDVSQNYEPIAAAHSFKSLQEQIASFSTLEIWPSLVATEREEM